MDLQKFENMLLMGEEERTLVALKRVLGYFPVS